MLSNQVILFRLSQIPIRVPKLLKFSIVLFLHLLLLLLLHLSPKMLVQVLDLSQALQLDRNDLRLEVAVILLPLAVKRVDELINGVNVLLYSTDGGFLDQVESPRLDDLLFIFIIDLQVDLWQLLLVLLALAALAGVVVIVVRGVNRYPL